ncbi:MAG TPA: GntR family transcriptional regulator [Pyrinomonadaceae bacterium]|jgi:GntR family transcriptional regulator|nr:GntR family transcriptional regulator [Pyrinomonadaceae bacterium]
MLLWLSKNSEVPLREQLTTQIMLGIVSDDLKPEQRLPSTRELARRYHIHSNTVSAAYRELERRGWLQFRKGSGVYVRALTDDALALDSRLELDQLIASFLRLARGGGFSLGEIQTRIKHWLELQPPDHFLVVESDAELRRILIAEITEATGFPARGASFEECAADAGLLAGAAAVAMYGQAERVRATLPRGTGCLLLRSRSVPDALRGEQLPPPDALVAVVSRWPEFLHWSRVVLLAAGVDAEALSLRDARERGWQKGLLASAFVITDTLTAAQLPAGCTARIFRSIADSSLDELRSFVQRFLTDLPAEEKRKKKEKRKKG